MQDDRFNHRKSEEDRRRARESQQIEEGMIERWLKYARDVLGNEGHSNDDDPTPSAA